MPSKQPGNNKTPAALAEEAAFIKQKCASLVMRGHYLECAKLIEENVRILYAYERWPEDFVTTLKSFLRCYPALNKNDAPEVYLRKLLKKNGIPFVLAGFTQDENAPPRWNAEFFRDRAVALRAEKDYETALGYCDIAMKIDTASSNLWLFRAWLLEDLERLAEAAEAAEQALDLNKSNKRASQTLVRLYGDINLNQALAFTEKMIKEYPDDESFYAEKASVLRKMKRTGDALHFYELASGLSQYNAEYPYEMAEIYLGDGDEAKALMYYKRAAALDLRHVPSLTKLAFMYEEKNPSAALEYAESLLLAEPVNIEGMLLTGRLLLRLGNRQEAIGRFEGVLALDKRNVEAFGGAAAAYLPIDSERAASYFSKALEERPGDIDFLTGRAQAYMAAGDIEAAAGDYRAVIQADKDNAEALGRLAFLCRSTEPKTALDYISRALRLEPENHIFHTEKAHILLVLGREGEAAESFDTAARIDPGNAALRCELGLLLQKIGNGASAVKNLKEAVNIDPRIAEAYHALAELHMYSRPDEAFAFIDKAINLEVFEYSHYYIKSRVLVRLDMEPHSRERLKKYAAGLQDETRHKEMSEILAGKCLPIALIYINRAVSLNPRDNVSLCEQARLMCVLGHPQEALEHYRKLLKVDPDNHGALFGTAEILSSGGDAKALEYYDKAISLSSDTAAYYFGKAGHLARDEAKYVETLDCYDKALTLDTYNHLPALEKGRFMEAGGDIPGAMASYRRTLLINPNCLEAAERMYELLTPIRPVNALGYADLAMFLDSTNPKHRMWRARVLYGQKRDAEAASECECVLNMREDSASLCYELAAVLGALFAKEALVYAVRAAEEGGRAEYHTLCGKLCLSLREYDKARAFFDAALEKNPRDAEAALCKVELLYRLGLPESVQAVETLGNGVEETVIKARVLAEIAEPPRIKEAAGIFAAAVKRSPGDLVLRGEYIEFLGKNRLMARYLIERARLGRMKAKISSAANASDAKMDSFMDGFAAETDSGFVEVSEQNGSGGGEAMSDD